MYNLVLKQYFKAQEFVLILLFNEHVNVEDNQTIIFHEQCTEDFTTRDSDS